MADLPCPPLTPLQHRLRAAGARLPHNQVGRWGASVLLRAMGGKTERAFEVDVFGTQRARLHPFDNISEKRVLITEQFWEAPEREALGALLARSGARLRFADVGANAGLYTLFVASRADARGQALDAVLVEPDPVMRARAEANLALSGVAARLLPWAAAAEAGRLTLTLHSQNRGENSIEAQHADPGGEAIEVEARPLADVFTALGGAPDVMKLDIEGAEERALRGMIETCPPDLWPAAILMEGAPGGRNDAAIRLLTGAGYDASWRSTRNLILTRR